MLETTDTSQEITPEGDHSFTIIKPVLKKMSDRGKPYYIFTFEYLHEGTLKTHKEFYMPWMAGEIIKAVGGKEVEGKKGVYEWDKDAVVGKKIKATIVHEPDFKDKTKVRAKMTNPVEEVPF